MVSMSSVSTYYILPPYDPDADGIEHPLAIFFKSRPVKVEKKEDEKKEDEFSARSANGLGD